MGLHRAKPKPLYFTTQSHPEPSEIWEKHSKCPKLWYCFDFLFYLHMRPIPFIRHCLWSAPFPWKASCIYLKLQRVPVNFLEAAWYNCEVAAWSGGEEEQLWRCVFFSAMLLRNLEPEAASFHTCTPLTYCTFRICCLLFGLWLAVSCGVCTGPGMLGSLSHLVSFRHCCNINQLH